VVIIDLEEMSAVFVVEKPATVVLWGIVTKIFIE
jgi:hypothetical protein